jgi:glycosyltransferase involved in cell wall biosynthesis
VLPRYRTAFFNRLALACQGGLSVFAGHPRAGEGILPAEGLNAASYAQASNIHLLAGALYVCYQRGLLDWLRTWNPDILVTEANARLLSTRLAVTWMHRRGRPVLGWSLGSPRIDGPLGAVRRRARRRFLAQFDGLIAYSTLGAAQFREAGFPASRIFVAPNAVASPPGPLPLRPAPGHRPPSVLFLGRLQARKRLDLLLNACASIDPRPELWIVGDGPARAQLERMAAAILPSTHFTGTLEGDALEAIFARCDLFVLPGTGGLAAQEAMAHGLPLVVAEGDGTQHDLVRPESGWLVPEDDLKALTEALRHALSGPARLRRMGAESHRIVAEEINIETMTHAFVRALNAVHPPEA